MSFQPLTSLVSLLKRLWTFCLCHGTSRQKHDKNVWEWSHVLGEGMDFRAKEWSFCFGMVWLNISDVKREQWLCRSSSVHTRIKSYFSCLTTFTVYVFQLVCQYDDIPLASLIYCKRTFFPMCRMFGNVNTLVYFYLAVCTSVFIP